MENQAIAMYLADRQNFDAYNQALIEHTKTLETQYGANLQREIDVLNPAILQPGADTELVAQDQNIEVSEDGILTADQGLQVLTDKVLAYVEKLPEMNIGEGIDYNNISFSQMIHHDYMATTWYDQIYGSEFTVGDRSVVDTVLENGLSMEDAAKITGLDINESLDLENPENLALFTETVFLMTHGKNLPEGVTYNKEQFLVASYNVLGEEIPKEKTPEQVENEMLHAKIDNISSNLYNDLYNFVELDSDLPNAPQGLRDLKQLKIDMDTSDTNLLNTRKSFLADNPDIDIVDYEHPADLKRDMYIAENEFIKSFLDMPETEQQAILKYITDRTHEIETELKQGNTPDATKHTSLNVSTPFTGAASPIPFEGDAQQYAAKLKEMGNPDVGANTPSNLPKPEAFA